MNKKKEFIKIAKKILLEKEKQCKNNKILCAGIFGSIARDDNNPSDIDLIFIREHKQDNEFFTIGSRNLLNNTNFRVSIFTYTLDEAIKRINTINSDWPIMVTQLVKVFVLKDLNKIFPKLKKQLLLIDSKKFEITAEKKLSHCLEYYKKCEKNYALKNNEIFLDSLKNYSRLLAITYMLYYKKYFLDYSNYIQEINDLKYLDKKIKDIFPYISCTKTLDLDQLFNKLQESWVLTTTFFDKKGFEFK
ncbi:MAG: nucleotidyltransferase domain-containing protein [Candidatus ainarchaeum sp.]|nr:nucleotidyltransferase domain-containing protein [Candidatus ainarchaeum sp.]